MPFKSAAQWGWAFARKMPWAKRWARATPGAVEGQDEATAEARRKEEERMTVEDVALTITVPQSTTSPTPTVAIHLTYRRGALLSAVAAGEQDLGALLATTVTSWDLENPDGGPLSFASEQVGAIPARLGTAILEAIARHEQQTNPDSPFYAPRRAQ